jgi:glucose/arabinose dehydrogenase
MKQWTILAIAVAILLAPACGGGGSTAASSPPSPAQSSSPTTASPPQTPTASPKPLPLGSIHLRLRKVATMEVPIAMAVRPGDPAVYVAEKTGRVFALRGAAVGRTPVLDVSVRLSLGSEQGLLGIAFGPDGRHLYADYTDTGGNTHVTQWTFSGGKAQPNTERGILFVRQPYANHNGGQIAFGPDGDLYVALGDGGSEGDPQGNGQNLGTLLGKILRIRPTPGGPKPYVIPNDNPFVRRPGARPEIWAYGLRNPWRFTFDRQTGDLWIGDVGQSAWEEIDVQPEGARGGRNYGWNRTEGDHPYLGAEPANWTRPVFEYSHASGGCAIIGGYVYRGSAIPGLWGAYLFSDNCLGGIAALRLRQGRLASERGMGVKVSSPSSFGQDANGELYLLSLSGPVYRVARG